MAVIRNLAFNGASETSASAPDSTYVRDLPGFDPTHTNPDRDYDLDDLEASALVTYGFVPTGDYVPGDSKHVLELMDQLNDDPDFCPRVVVMEPGSDGYTPTDLVTGAHRLTAAYWLGWKLYPAYIVHSTAAKVSAIGG
jgi:hypothetical protein